MSSTASKTPLQVINLHEPILVQPLVPTARPPHDAYFLSNVDLSMAPYTVKIMLVFNASPLRNQHNAAHTMKQALQKVLVHYYPLAGRLRQLSPRERPFVECNAAGVSFVEAHANIEMSDLVDDCAWPDAATLGKLILPFPLVEDPPLLTAKVTRFKCGGFVLGLVFQHCMLDGAGVGEFLNAWGETTRGLPLSVPPLLDRTFLKARSPLQIEHRHSEHLHADDLVSAAQDIFHNPVTKSFYFSPVSLENLKKKVLEEDGTVLKCTAFEVLAGLLWKAHTKALAMRREQKAKLMFPVNEKSNVKKTELPKGYMGNRFVIVNALATAGELEEEPLSHAVKHVQRAKASSSMGYMRSQIDSLEHEGLAVPSDLLAASCIMTSWCRLPFYEADFGSGTPKHVWPDTSMTNQAVFFLSGGEDREGIDVVLGLPPEAAQKLEELLLPHLNP